MFINKFLSFFQGFNLYNKSFILQKLDYIILILFALTIVSSAFVSSDTIGNFALLIILLTAIKMLTKPGERFKLSLADIFLLLYFLVVMISVAGSTLFYLSFKGFCKTIIYLGFYVSFIHYFQEHKKHIILILMLLSCICFAESFVALHQNFISVSEISGWQDVSHINPEDVMTRVYGTLKPYNPNLFGGYILAILPSTLFIAIWAGLKKYYKFAILGFCTFILGLLTVFLTGCRGAYLGIFTELIVLFLISYKFIKPTLKKAFLYLSGIISFIGFIIIMLIHSLRTRILSIFAMRNDSSNSFRFNVYQSCIHMFKDNFILGIGVGNQNFREIYGLYMRTGFDALSAYNIYLETAVESGIFALLAFLGFIITTVSTAIKYISKRRNASTLYLIIAIISISGILVHGFVDTVFFRPQIQFVFWIMVGIIRVLTTNRARRIQVK